MASLTIEVETDSDFPVGELQNRFDLSDRGKQQVMRAIRNHLNGVASGQHRAIMRVAVNTSFASQTITCDTSAATAGNTTLTVGGQLFTTVTTAATPTATQIALGATDTAFATNTVASINANSTASKLVVATSSGAVVTVTARLGGPVGNFITLAEAQAGFALGAATLAGGSGDEVDEFDFGHT